jgi:hypothetical protein
MPTNPITCISHKTQLLLTLLTLGCVPSVAQGETIRAGVGTEWVYRLTDNITNKQSTKTVLVTEVAQEEITVRITWTLTGYINTWIYDKDWDVLQDATWKYVPNSGTGIRRTVDANWSQKVEASKQEPGGWVKQATPRVVGRAVGSEQMTTEAGTFDRIKLEVTYKGHAKLTPQSEVTITHTYWFAPEIDHWVKQVTETRVSGKLQQKWTEELLHYEMK